MKFSSQIVSARIQAILTKLNVYISMKKLNEEQRIDFQDLQGELATLQRVMIMAKEEENDL